MSLPTAHLAPSCPSRRLDVGTATCTLHTGSTLGAMPPYHLSPLSACPEEPAQAVWPSRHQGHSLRYSPRTHKCPQPGTQRHCYTWGHTRAQPGTWRHSHTHTGTYTHTRTHKCTHPKTQRHSHTQVSQTHTRTHNLEHAQPRTQRIAGWVTRCMLLGTRSSSHPQKYTDTHRDAEIHTDAQ